VNDLEHDLREVLDDDARRVPTPTSAPEGFRRSVRRRQAVFGGVIALSALAVVAGIVAGATTLLSFQSGPNPAAQGPTTTGTLNGITITYPRAWHLIDPDTAGLNGSPQMSESPLPRIVLALSPTQAPETFGCPGRSNGEAATSLMTIEEEPPTLGDLTTSWPVELRPTGVDASESGCYQGWRFMRAGWIAAGRMFEAHVGFSPAASDDERAALDAAFASMSFEPSSDGVTSVVLAHGTAGGEDWQLVASRAKGGLSIEIVGKTTGTGMGGLNTSTDLLGSEAVFGSASQAERLVFGVVPEEVDRVEASTVGGSTVSADVLDVPSQIDRHLNAFVMVVGPSGPVQLTGYDASGQVVATGSVGGVVSSPSPVDAALEDGRHFGYVRSVDPAAGTMEFDLAYFLSGKEADRAYQEATGDTGHVPNDHFVVNDNPMLRTFTLAPNVRLRLLDWNHCCETFFDGDLALFAQAIGEQADVTDGDLIYRGQSSWWITIQNGVVTEIEEQYSP
jgi:hypothetical protein